MMLEKLRARSKGESGFTLVELLVVMLILGILAAIAIPSFFNQRNKATDSEAKAGARTAQTAIETFATDNNGSYTTADPAALRNIEETLTDLSTRLTVSGTADREYTVSVQSDRSNGPTFSIQRADTGVTTYSCTPVGGGCPSSGFWAGNQTP